MHSRLHLRHRATQTQLTAVAAIPRAPRTTLQARIRSLARPAATGSYRLGRSPRATRPVAKTQPPRRLSRPPRRCDGYGPAVSHCRRAGRTPAGSAAYERPRNNALARISRWPRTRTGTSRRSGTTAARHRVRSEAPANPRSAITSPPEAPAAGPANAASRPARTWSGHRRTSAHGARKSARPDRPPAGRASRCSWDRADRSHGRC